MQITLYNYAGDKNKIRKNISGGTPIDCTPYDTVSVMYPSVILSYNSSIETANYAVMDGKYYFIDNIERMTGGKVLLRLHIDVLKTYESAILALPAIAARTENGDLQNAYLVDPFTQRYAYTRNISALGGTFTYSNDLILLTAG